MYEFLRQLEMSYCKLSKIRFVNLPKIRHSENQTTHFSIFEKSLLDNQRESDTDDQSLMKSPELSVIENIRTFSNANAKRLRERKET